MNYPLFLDSKAAEAIPVGFDAKESAYPKAINDHQRVSTTWACRRGRSALFFDTGLGKTLAQLAWADQVVTHTGRPVLVLAPLAVSHQTVREGIKFGIPVCIAQTDAEVTSPAIYVTNYEKLAHFNTKRFGGVVLDESSILKGMNGKMRKQITDGFNATPYKLSCTATPSPNDYMELGTQSEFLGIMSQTEMLAMFFIHDGSDTSKWRLKGHAKNKFWEWLSTWAIFLRSPADLGFDGSEYDLPQIHYHNHVIKTEPCGSLFVEPAQGLLERNRARKDSVGARCKQAAAIVNAMDESAIVWCHLNQESKMLAALINGAVEVTGSDKDEHKSKTMLDFADGTIKSMVSKPKIAGFGMNFQSSHHCIFVGLSDSWEAFYQAVRRQWRFGQKHDVHVHIVSADTEGAVVENIRRKEQQHEEMASAMMDHMRILTQKTVIGATVEKADYLPHIKMSIPGWLKTAT